MISIQDLSFSYPHKPVFSGLSLQFRAGHVYGLLGKNGTGKSSLLRTIAGLLRPQSGAVTVKSFTPFDRKPDFLADVFLVPEEFSLPDLDLPDFIRYYAPFYPRFERDKFSRCLSAFGIEAGETLTRLSYGQKKKVLISFALATHAAVLLLDEPTNGLDIAGKSSFRKLLAEAVDEDRCIVISTHQVKDLQNLIDRVTVIDSGRILFDADVDAITSKLSFRFAPRGTDLASAYYTESSLMGHAVVAPNDDGGQGSLDLELLCKALETSPDRITNLFKA
jgi:ABC-2 type transport system ATP-binding protein